jgi:hypothetical protein
VVHWRAGQDGGIELGEPGLRAITSPNRLYPRAIDNPLGPSCDSCARAEWSPLGGEAPNRSDRGSKRQTPRLKDRLGGRRARSPALRGLTYGAGSTAAYSIRGQEHSLDWRRVPARPLNASLAIA